MQLSLETYSDEHRGLCIGVLTNTGIHILNSRSSSLICMLTTGNTFCNQLKMQTPYRLPDFQLKMSHFVPKNYSNVNSSAHYCVVEKTNIR